MRRETWERENILHSSRAFCDKELKNHGFCDKGDGSQLSHFHTCDYILHYSFSY